MPRSYLRYTTAAGRDDFIYFDAVLSSSIIRESLVPEHEVETGTNTTDDTRAKPTVIRIEAFVSNTPLEQDTPLEVLQEAYETPAINRATQVEAALADIETRKVPVEINLLVGRNPDPYALSDYQTNVYFSYLLQSAETAQDKETGDGIKVTLTLRELKYAESRTVKVAQSASKAVPNAKKDLGRQGAATSKETRSVAKVYVDKTIETGNPITGFLAAMKSIFGGQ